MLLYLLLAVFPLWLAIARRLCAAISVRLIPHESIIAEAKERLGRDGDRALEILFIDADRAWRYGDTRLQFRLERIAGTLMSIRAANGLTDNISHNP